MQKLTFHCCLPAQSVYLMRHSKFGKRSHYTGATRFNPYERVKMHNTGSTRSTRRVEGKWKLRAYIKFPKGTKWGEVVRVELLAKRGPHSTAGYVATLRRLSAENGCEFNEILA